ncbi:hypothetical protein [Rhodanobacter glycinis]|jgi:hypothetical protein|uniref:Uncharacterized protein n=1 Tax=Rhodanobacter glycinis TaxID=582702 RepID=A0A1I4F490_9GAMM|nr:hypothetical protein [Rhodanobacter glycinis]SFL12090.1 hypothetical protein SAMN05192579_11557 [Rhodanobacter glycinis]
MPGIIPARMMGNGAAFTFAEGVHVNDAKLSATHLELLRALSARGQVPRAEVPAQLWEGLEARGLLERTLAGYLRLTKYGRTALNE